MALVSCADVGRERRVIVLDEAFVAAYPELTALLRSPSAFGGQRAFSSRTVSAPLVISLSQSPGLALDAVREAEGGKPGSALFVTSPLIASALIGGGVWKGHPSLLVPEWRGEIVPGLISARTDPVPAYRAVGAALGAYTAHLARDGGSPSCGVLFSEGPLRPREAIEAFIHAYADASAGARPLVRELVASSTAPEAVPDDAAPTSADNRAPSRSLSPEEAVNELLGSDIRTLFIALGPDTIAAVRAASRPGLALGADYADPSADSALAFRILPDWRGIATSLVKRPSSSVGGGTEAATTILVPALVEVLGSASLYKAGGRGLGAYIKDATASSAR